MQDVQIHLDTRDIVKAIRGSRLMLGAKTRVFHVRAHGDRLVALGLHLCLQIDILGTGKAETVFLKDWMVRVWFVLSEREEARERKGRAQMHPVTSELTHVEFMRFTPFGKNLIDVRPFGVGEDWCAEGCS